MFQDVLAGGENYLDWVTSMADDGVLTYSFNDMKQKRFTKRVMATLDALIPDIDIVKVRGEADIEMYGVDAMPTNYENAVGLAQYKLNSKNERSVDLLFDWDAINYTSVRKVNANSRKYTILHEIGHAFGLEHPFDAGDGDSLYDTDSSFSVMSYNSENQIINGRVSNFTTNDIDTISGIWNDTSRFSDVIKEEPDKPLPLCFTCGCRH